MKRLKLLNSICLAGSAIVPLATVAAAHAAPAGYDKIDNIVVIYLGGKQTFLPCGTRVLVDGKLEMGSWTDPDTGFLSRLRIRDARFREA